MQLSEAGRKSKSGTVSNIPPIGGEIKKGVQHEMLEEQLKKQRECAKQLKRQLDDRQVVRVFGVNIVQHKLSSQL